MGQKEISTPYGYTIFCDDIRQEEGGKTSFMGVYRGLMTLPAIPMTLPKFCLAIWYFERANESTEPLEFRAYFPWDPDGKPSFSAPITNPSFRDAPMPTGVSLDAFPGIEFHVAFAPLEIKSAGTIRVSAFRGELEIRLGSLPIFAK